MRLFFEIHLLADYHVGSGHGLGSQIDSALLRDHDGVPVFRGTTIEGLLRDGLWRLLQTELLQSVRKCQTSGLSESGHHYCLEQLCPICSVFGRPAQPKHWQFSSARPMGAKQHLATESSWKSGETGAQVVTRIHVNPRMRRAETHQLFQEEEGDHRLVFAFTAQCPDNNQDAHAEAAWLVAAARMVRRLGSARRRGRGECTITLVNVEGWYENKPENFAWHDYLLNYFRSVCLEQKPKTITVVPQTWPDLPASSATPQKFRLIVRLDEPVVLSRRSEAGNMFDSKDEISGVTVLGAFAALAASRWNLKNPQIYQQFLRIFRRGAVRFMPLYVAYVDQKKEIFPTIPTPLDMLVCKCHQRFNKRHTPDNTFNPITSYAVSHIPTECPMCHKGIPLVHPGGFVPVCEAWVGKVEKMAGKPIAPQFREEMHPAMDPHTQRVAAGNLFGYVALEAGQYFMGELECQDGTAWETLRQLTGGVQEKQPFNLHLGKAIRRGYGLATAWIEKIPEGMDIWRGKPLTQRVADIQNPITLTLLTDAIVQDDWGRFYQSLEHGLLQKLLGQEVEMLQMFCKTKPVDNFNNHLGLPRWRDTALQEGSAVGFKVKGTISTPELQSVLAKIEHEGIGLRRHEGFGKIAFNHPVYQDGTGVEIPFEMRQIPHSLDLTKAAEVADSAKTIQEEEQFLQEWTQSLQDEFASERFAHNQWDAVARWLWSMAGKSLEDIKSGLDSFGKPALLTEVPRLPKEPFTEEAQIAYLKTWLDKLATQNCNVRGKAMRILADRITLCCKSENKGGR